MKELKITESFGERKIINIEKISDLFYIRLNFVAEKYDDYPVHIFVDNRPCKVKLANNIQYRVPLLEKAADAFNPPIPANERNFYYRYYKNGDKGVGVFYYDVERTNVYKFYDDDGNEITEEQAKDILQHDDYINRKLIDVYDKISKLGVSEGDLVRYLTKNGYTIIYPFGKI